MDCRDYLRCLAGELPQDDDAMRAHRERCPHCAALDETPPLDDPEGFTRSVLERTSGQACRRAEDLIGQGADELLAEARLLLGAHLGRCTGCRELVRTLAEADARLPSMAAIPAPVSLAAEVLRRTRSRPRPGRRLADVLGSLLGRPRLALELAYVGAVAVWCVALLADAGPASAVQKAVSWAGHNPVPMLAGSDGAVAALGRDVSNLGRRGWEVTARQGSSAWNSGEEALRTRYRTTAAARRGLRQTGAELGRAALELDLDRGITALSRLPRHLGRFWNGLVEDRAPSSESDATPSDRPATETT